MTFAGFVVKGMGPIMALVLLLERLVMTVGKIPFSNDQFLARASVPIATTWRFEALWDWTAFFALQAVKGHTDFRKLTFCPG